MNINQLRELIDSCRPDRKDLTPAELQMLTEAIGQDAELQQRWETLETNHTEMRAAMHRVAVPEGMADRLVASAKQWQQRDAEREDTSGVDRVQNEEVEADAASCRPATNEREQDERHRGARWVAVAMCVASVAATIAIIAWFGPWRDELSGVQVAHLARGWLRAVDREAWQGAQPPLNAYPIDPSLRFTSIRWQRIGALDDRQAIVYQASVPPDSSVAYLLVVRTRRAMCLPSAPPTVPQSTTEGLCIGAWQSRGLLYVLAVPGSPVQYRRAINSQSFVLLERARLRVAAYASCQTLRAMLVRRG